MRRLLLHIILVIPLFADGQLYTSSDNWVHYSLAINPAYSGSANALSTSLGYRNYFSAFEGSPKTMTFTAHAPLNYEKIGVGFFIMNDQIGISNETSFTGNYAYRIDLGQGKLAFGLGFGLTYRNTAWDKLAVTDSDDELISENFSSGVLLDFSTGIYYSTSKYFFGFSMPMFLSHEFDPVKEKYVMHNKISEYNYFGNAGYLFDIDENIKFLPSLLVKRHQNSNQIDINTQFIFKEVIRVGVSYRSKNTIVGMVQCQVNKQLKIAYSYDFLVSKTGKYGNSCHELMLNYVFNYSAEIPDPRHF